MKKIILVILALATYQISFSQSFSSTQLLNLVNSKSKEKVVSIITAKGFRYNSTDSEYGNTGVTYILNGKRGEEQIIIMKNEELFGIIYGTNLNYYSTLKEILLTSDFGYAYSGGGNKYYENQRMRIGTNDKYGILSFFVAK